MNAERVLNIVISADDKASAKMKTVADKISGGLKTIGIAAGVAGAALGAMLIKSAKDFAELGEQLDNLRQSSGVAVGALSVLKMKTGEMGLSMESATTSIKKMQDGIYQASTGNKTLSKSFETLGIKLSTLKGQTPEQQFFTLGNAIAAIDDPVKRTALAMDIFGKSGTDIIPIFQNGKASLEEYTQAAKDAGVYMDEISMKKALALDEAMDKMSTAWTGLKNTIAGVVAPAITSLIENHINPLLTKFQNLSEENQALVLKIIGVGGAILGLLVVLPILVSGLTAVGTVLAFIAANPVVLIIGAIMALIAAIVLLIANWDLVKAKAVEVWNAMQDHITKIILSIQNAFSSFWAWLTDIWNTGLGAISQAWQDTWSGIKNFVDGILGTISTLIDNTIGRIQSAVEAVKNLASAAGQGISAAGSAVKAGFVAVANKVTGKSSHNASGGNVFGGQVSLVGERGPELVQFGRSGRVIPNSRLGDGSTNINIILKDNTLLSSADEVAIKLGDMIINRLRLQTRIA